MEKSYNMRCPAVKRILREAQELHLPTEEYYAQPLDDNLFEWHFTVRGPIDSEFENGIYHGRIILPNEYPMKPPNIIFTTMNGRFEVHKKICLSISGHHPESWRPSWSIRTALLAIIGYMPSSGMGNLASLDYSPDERRRLAKRSVTHECPVCGPVATVLLPRVSTNAAAVSEEARNISSQMSITEKALEDDETDTKDSSTTPATTKATSNSGTVPHPTTTTATTDSLLPQPDKLRQRVQPSTTDSPATTEHTSSSCTIPTITSPNGNTASSSTTLSLTSTTATATTPSPTVSTSSRTPSTQSLPATVAATSRPPPHLSRTARILGGYTYRTSALCRLINTSLLVLFVCIFVLLLLRRIVLVTEDNEGSLVSLEDDSLY